MSAHRIIQGALLLAAAQLPFVIGCAPVAEGPDGAESEAEPDSGDDADPGPESSDATSGGGADAPDPALDLFACSFEPSCEPVTMHSYPSPPEALPCAAKLVTGGGTGVLSSLLAPGPYIDETESLIFVLGDGTALVQTRERHCGREGMECGPTLVWEAPSPHQICDLVVSPDLEAACEEDAEGCAWRPWADVANCRSVEEHTCEDVTALLAAM
ncbi:hypothetical protein WMF27_33245 [Sorangium sp. So ce281]|uniref:hypothetical protein n=1 Tax=unclassified Sorangium TaxID=2621164 RepID=UPI003F62B4D7